ncbi:MAG: DNA polymerase III subunit gamma/tau [Enterobacteriaceae bacterium]
MNYYTLARKYRPNNFKEVVGQKDILLAILNSIKLKKIHYAYLFSGERGVGKTTIARLFAKSLSCKKGITVNHCNKCNNCLEIKEGTNIDIIEIDGASHTKIEEIKKVLNNVRYPPISCKFKIYIIDEVHMLSKYSFNALLKILEEPPIFTKFIFATTEVKKIPLTIISRCLHFKLSKLNKKDIKKKINNILKENKIKFRKEAIDTIIYASKGSMRDALNLIDHAITAGDGFISSKIVNSILKTLNSKQILFILELLIKKKIKKLLKYIDIYDKYNIDWDDIITKILIFIHKIIMEKSNIENYSSEENEYINSKIKKLSNIVDIHDIYKYYRLFIEGRKNLCLAPTTKIGIEIIIFKTTI